MSLYEAFVTLLSIFLGFILATITLVSFLQVPASLELRRLALWLLLASFAIMDVILVRTHSRILKQMIDSGETLFCPWGNDELLTLAIALICISFSPMLLIGGLSREEAITWFIISVILAAWGCVLIRKVKHSQRAHINKNCQHQDG